MLTSNYLLHFNHNDDGVDDDDDHIVAKTIKKEKNHYDLDSVA